MPVPQKTWKPKTIAPNSATLPPQNTPHPHTSGLSGQENSMGFVDVSTSPPAAGPSHPTLVPIVFRTDVPPAPLPHDDCSPDTSDHPTASPLHDVCPP